MEEVDSILISQLREIGCDLDGSVEGISSLDSYQIMQCVTICLHRIVQDSTILETIPSADSMNSSMNMSVKYKLANQLSTCIKNIGYKSDIGYQTFLYSNEHEIRRLLLFLIEHISTDIDDKTEDQSDWMINEKNVLHKLKHMKINTVWVPYSSSFDDYADFPDEIKYCSESDYHDCFDIQPDFNSIYGALNLDFSIKSYLSNSQSKQLAKYSKYKLENHGKILPDKIIDILEWNNHFWKNEHSDQIDQNKKDFFENYLKTCEIKQINPVVLHSDHIADIINQDDLTTNLKFDQTNKESNDSDHSNESNNDQHKTQHEQILSKLRDQLKEYDDHIIKLRNEERDLVQFEQEYQQKCKHFEASFKTKEELENGIQTIKNSIEEITTTWAEMQQELVTKLKEKKMQNVAQNEEEIEKLKIINTMKKSITQKLKEIQSKELLIQELESKIPEQWPPGRGSYTRRIMEIIQNVKKQNDETRKVVLETKSIQKDINNLNGKIERSFTVAEEVLFREAKQNEWNRKCYKSLALLQSTFIELLQAISDIGVHLREIRKLEEMIESENNRKTSSNLTRINADLEQIRLENKQLKQKLQQQNV